MPLSDNDKLLLRNTLLLDEQVGRIFATFCDLQATEHEKTALEYLLRPGDIATTLSNFTHAVQSAATARVWRELCKTLDSDTK